MNRYTALGMISDAAAGARVLYVGVGRTECRAAFSELRYVLDAMPTADDSTIRLTNGQERVSFNSTGGQIRFLSTRQVLSGRVRGTLLDAVVVPFWDRLSDAEKEDLIREVGPAAATRERGLELIRP
jgi:hypothetical protein